jgi:hypothetical protein
LLKQIIDILRQPDRHILEHMPTLRSDIDEHHDLCLKLYGQAIVKIKPHLMYHILDSIDYWKIGANCFCAERNHQYPKSFALNCRSGGLQGSSYELYMLRRSVLQTLHAIAKSRFTHTYLMDPRPAPWFRDTLLPFRSDIGRGVYVSDEIRTERGRFRRGDFFLLLDGASPSIGLAKFFVSATTLLSSAVHCACFSPCTKVDAGTWVPTSTVHLCSSTALVAQLPFLAIPGQAAVRPILPFIPGLQL